MARSARIVVVGSQRAAAGLGRRRLLLICVLLLALAALGYVRQASLVAAAGYDVQELQAIRQRRLATIEQLRFQLAEMRALDRVAREAERRGLAAAEEIVYVRFAAPLRSPAVATPAAAPNVPAAASVLDDLRRLLRP
ncbi:MAG: hypothetical protein HY691_06915 [Chloroflexi bacterium]|nr:hypothetical protein [Chloroflexota bacterium]